MRLIGGAWCLVALILVTAYCSILTSFLTAPHLLPLVETVEDVAEKAHVNPATIKAWAVDVMISVTIRFNH